MLELDWLKRYPVNGNAQGFSSRFHANSLNKDRRLTDEMNIESSQDFHS